MIPYYGSKGNMVNFYPPPMFGKIIEPFAGSARYALKYYDRDVLLVDKYDVIIKIWKWLQLCSKDDILKLPRMKEGERVSDHKFDCEEAALLMGFLVGRSVESPRNKATWRATTARPNGINYNLKKIANNLFKIKHWKIDLGDYADIPNQKATWYVDPPYEFGGYIYKESGRNIDYISLAEWCQSRSGQAIVCENTSGTWLPFVPMKSQRGSNRSTTEAIWSNYPTPFDFRQQEMFQEMPA